MSIRVSILKEKVKNFDQWDNLGGGFNTAILYGKNTPMTPKARGMGVWIFLSSIVLLKLSKKRGTYSFGHL